MERSSRPGSRPGGGLQLALAAFAASCLVFAGLLGITLYQAATGTGVLEGQDSSEYYFEYRMTPLGVELQDMSRGKSFTARYIDGQRLGLRCHVVGESSHSTFNGSWQGQRALLKASGAVPRMDRGDWRCLLISDYDHEELHRVTFDAYTPWAVGGLLLLLLGMLPALLLLWRRAHLIANDPRFRCQWLAPDGPQAGELQVTTTQLVFYSAQSASPYWHIDGATVLGVKSAMDRVTIQTADSGSLTFRIRALKRDAYKRGGLKRVLQVLVLLVVIGPMVSGLGVLLKVPELITAGTVLGSSFLLLVPLIWPGLWVANLMDAYLLRKQVMALAARWRPQG